MALIKGKSGTIQFSNKYDLFSRINWWEEYSIEENYSIVYADMEMMADSYSYQGKWYPSGSTLNEPGQILIGGEVVAELHSLAGTGHYANITASNVWSPIINPDTAKAPPWSSGKIYHNSDGTGSTTIATTRFLAYRESDTKRHVFGTIAAQTITLTTIPRKSGITSAAAVTLGKACSVRWTPLSASFQYKLKFSLEDWSYTTGYIKPNTTSAYTYTGYTIPLDVAEEFPKAASGTMTVTLYSYSGSTNVGSDSKTFKVTLPENSNTKPTISDLVLTALDSPFDGVFVQGNSKVKVAFTKTGRYGAEITSAKMTVEGKSYTEPYISDPISGYGDIKLTITVTDTRGFTGSAEGTISVYAYSKPQVKVSMCQRCDANGNANDGGTYLTISASRSYSKVAQHNACTLRYRYAKQGETMGAWTTLLEPGASGDAVQTGALLGNLATDAIYIVEVGVIDTVGNTSETSYTILTEAVFMHEKAGGKGLGLGMYCTADNRLEVAWDSYFHGEVMVGGVTLKEYILAVISEGG